MGETSIKYPLMHGDDALALIDAYRSEIHDFTTVEELDREFPYYTGELGLTGVHLAHLEDNDAGTFKWRGALVGAVHLKREGAEKLLVPSAGNHARGAVWAARQLAMPITTVVPQSAPEKKRTKLRELWDSHLLNVRVVGENFDQALDWALHDDSGILLHPYGREVIPGQGTAVDDVLRLKPDTETLVLPVGGGGLVAGVLRRLAELDRLDIRVIGAEAEGSNSMSRSIGLRAVASAELPNQRYGGTAVNRVSQDALDICLASPNLTLTTVPEYDIDELTDWYESGRQELIRHMTPHLEPTSLLAVAALKQNLHSGETVVLGTGQNDVLRPIRRWVRHRAPI